jgi:hypothetical protein
MLADARGLATTFATEADMAEPPPTETQNSVTFHDAATDQNFTEATPLADHRPKRRACLRRVRPKNLATANVELSGWPTELRT